MAKLTRVKQNIFAVNAPSADMGVFGSLKAGSPQFSTDPATIQSLSNFLGGWKEAVLGGNSPAIEDMNSVMFLAYRQLAYLFQAGIPEWDSGTTYYTGSVVSSSGVKYTSLVDDNLNNAVSDTTKWRNEFQPPTITVLTDKTYYTFTVSSANTTAGATYTNNTKTFTVVYTISGGTTLVCTSTGAPTPSGTLTKSTGTGDSTISFSASVLGGIYKKPAGAKCLRIRMVGGGGGGGGCATAAAPSGGTGVTGGNSYFGSSLLTCNGGAGAVGGATGTTRGGAGGSYSINSPSYGVGFYGSGGCDGKGCQTTEVYAVAGKGGDSFFGGAGNSACENAKQNSGSGGAGAAVLTNLSQPCITMGGGGAGGFIEAIIKDPSAEYPFTVGAGGTGGTAGSGGTAGGNGADGIIIVEELY